MYTNPYSLDRHGSKGSAAPEGGGGGGAGRLRGQGPPVQRAIGIGRGQLPWNGEE